MDERRVWFARPDTVFDVRVARVCPLSVAVGLTVTRTRRRRIGDGVGLGAAGPKGRASLQWRARTGYLPALGGMRASASLATSSSPGQHLFLRQ